MSAASNAASVVVEQFVKDHYAVLAREGNGLLLPPAASPFRTGVDASSARYPSVQVGKRAPEPTRTDD
jgi:hypothetical protein